jgi:nucleotide-binding universal stress UspA family protein
MCASIAEREEKRKGIGRQIMGSVSHVLIEKAHCPVLVVK